MAESKVKKVEKTDNPKLVARPDYTRPANVPNVPRNASQTRQQALQRVIRDAAPPTDALVKAFQEPGLDGNPHELADYLARRKRQSKDSREYRADVLEG